MTLKEQRKAARNSPLVWFAIYCRILDKLRQEITPKPNVAQIRMAEAVEHCLVNKIPCRIIMVKPRKVGISTFAVAIAYWIMRKRKAFAAIIADKDARSDILFDILKFIGEKDRFPWGDGITPTFTHKKMSLGTADDSSHAEKFTAGNPNSTIGETPQILIATEAAHYPKGGAMDGSKTMTNTLASIPKKPNTFVLVESTAAGMSGFFPTMWQDAQWPTFYEPGQEYFRKYLDGQNQGTSAYIRVFVAWWEMDEYVLAVDNDQRAYLDRTLTPEEKKGIEAYGWSHEQLAWRRDTIKNECLGSETKFKEDFPSSPDEPFSVSGSPRFDSNGLTYLRNLAKSIPYKSGILSDIDPIRGGRPTFTPTQDNEAWVKLWELPKVGCRYFLGTDVAEDKDMNPATGDNEVKRDRHGPFVIRAGFSDDRGVRWRPREVGRIMPPCRWGHDLLAKRLYLLSVFFGGCPIAPEMNNHGLALAKELKRLGAVLYSQTIVDPLTQIEQKVYGHRTTPANRPDVIENLAKSIRNAEPKQDQLDETLTIDPDALEILDLDALSECGTFVIGKDGRAAASPGNHDDDVMGLAITFYLIGSATVYTEKIVERTIPKWDYQVAGDPKPRRSITGS